MAILALFVGRGWTKEMYESLRSEVKWERDHAPGGIFHAAGFDANGVFHVTDIWESETAMNEFVANRLAPGLQKVGAPMPEVQIMPLHNANAYPGIKHFAI